MTRTSPDVRRLAGRAYRKVQRTVRSAGDTPAETDATPADAPRPLPDIGNPPWQHPPLPDRGVVCNICRWQGEAFTGRAHCESAECPGCGSIGRDRYLHWCFTEQVELHPALRVIESSPRLGPAYRAAMGTWFFYRTSDYDLRAHAGNLQLDLQAIDLPDECVDVMLCAHVLEHVPDTDKALAELRRVLAPEGHLLLQVPVLQGRTAPPTEPEFHGDDTPVFWRFGFDLTARLREHGFTADLLCTQSWSDAVTSGANPWPEWSGEFDVPDMLDHAVGDDLTVIADGPTTTRLGLDPGYMYLTWDCAAR